MASIEKVLTSKGTYAYRIRAFVCKNAKGNSVFKSMTYTPKNTAPTKIEKEVKEAAREFEEKVLGGGIADTDSITFSKMVEIWRKNWLPQKTLTVQENYYDTLKRRVIPSIGHMKLAKITAVHIDNIIQKEVADGLAPKSVRYTFTVINSVFNYAVKKQYLSESPCVHCDDLPSLETNNELRFFTVKQAKAFLSSLEGEFAVKYKGHKRILKKTGEAYNTPTYIEKRRVHLQWQVFFNLAIYGGFRRGELCALTWEDIDFQNETVNIEKALARTKHSGQIVKDPKTKAGIRTLNLPSAIMQKLKQWQHEQKLLSLELGSAWQGKHTKEFDSNFVFIQLGNGLPVDLNTPTHKFRELIDLYNSNAEEQDQLPVIRLHDLRHTHATLLLSLGTDIQTVSHRLGHSKASVTLDVYGHALPENDLKAATALANLLA